MTCKRSCELGLTYTCWTQEDECTDRLFRFFQPHTVTLNGFHHFSNSFILTNHHSSHILRHAAQFFCFCLHHSLHGNTCHHTHNFCNIFFTDGIAFVLAFFFPFVLCFFKIFL